MTPVGFCSEGFPLPLGAWDRLCYFAVALPGSSIQLFWRQFFLINCYLVLILVVAMPKSRSPIALGIAFHHSPNLLR